MSSAVFPRILATSRPAFLLLTPCCLSLVVAYALAEKIPVSYLHLLLIFIGALASHISVNMLNEYMDFTSGLDFHTQRTPFSGGSGTLVSFPELANPVRNLALAGLLATVCIGFYFLWASGPDLLPVGLLGVLLVYFYTHKITHDPLLCLIAPGLGFGPLMINGAYFVLSGQYSAAVFSASFIVFFLVNNLLLLNQFPDLEADKKAGRCHLPILIGRKKSAWVYAGFLTAAYAILLLCVSVSFLPVYSLLGLFSLVLAVPATTMAVRHADDIPRLKPTLALNVAITLLTPVLVGIGLILPRLL